VAVGFASIVLGLIMFEAIRQTGGSWSGAGIALGASILVATLLGLDWPFASELIALAAVIAIVAGVLAFLSHSHRRIPAACFAPPSTRGESSEVRHDMTNLYEDGRVGDWLRQRFGQVREQADALPKRPEGAAAVMVELQRLLPAEGWLTEQLARLRAKAHAARNGHVARIAELHRALGSLPPDRKKQAADELAARYAELHFDKRLERLDRAVAENERRIRVLTQEAEQALVRSDFRALLGLLDKAGKLQAHNGELFQAINRTEQNLAGAIEGIARAVPGGDSK
jgi:hypothetical protein